MLSKIQVGLATQEEAKGPQVGAVLGNSGQQTQTMEEMETLEVTGKWDLCAHSRAVRLGTPNRFHS